MEAASNDKRSSLICQSIIDKEKRFIASPPILKTPSRTCAKEIFAEKKINKNVLISVGLELVTVEALLPVSVLKYIKQRVSLLNNYK